MEPPSLAVVQCPPTPASPAPVSAAATSLAPGFRFHPTDQELVSYYLKRKVCGKRIRFDAISETDIYKSEPWDLPALSRLQSKDNEWYFFGVQDRKYVNGSRVNRATGKGYWKATGNDRPIVHNSKTVGMKKTLVFYSGRAPCGKRTNWVMHEYRLTDEEIAKDGISLDSYLLCKILKKSGPGFKPGEQYGPFIEEEWDREDAAFIPGAETEEEANGDDDARIEDSTTHCFTASESQLLSPPPPPPPPPHPLGATVDPLIDTKSILPPCKVNTELGRLTRDGSPEPFPVVPSNKRLKCDPELSLSSEISATAITTNGSCSSSTATALTTSTTTTNTGLSLEFRLLESVGQKEEDAGGNGGDAAADGSRHFETHNRHMPMPINIMDVNVPPSYLKLFEDLRNEIYKISIEKESLKIEVMSARTMINILQSKIDHLTKVNEDLKRLTTREAP